MRFRFGLLTGCCLVALGFTSVAGAASSSRSDDAIRLLAFGFLPAADAPFAADATPTEKWNACRRQLTADSELAAQVTARARFDAYGESVASTAPANETYFEQLNAHLAALADDAAAHEQVVHRAYQFVIQRDAYAEEITYWRERPGPLSYLMLVGCIEDWARRNQPGLMVTAGTPTVSINSEFFGAVRLLPAEAAEVRAAIGFSEIATPGAHVIAPSAQEIQSAGGIHFAAVGAPVE